MKPLLIIKRTVYVRLAMICCPLLLFSCGKEMMTFDTNVKTPVIESYLTTGASNLSVKVYSMESFNESDNQYSSPIKGLDLCVNDRKLTENQDGSYSLDFSDGMLDSGKVCTLNFNYNNQAINASTTMPSMPQNLQISQSVIYRSSTGFWGYGDTIPNVVITWDNNDNSYYQVYIRSLDGSTSISYPSFGGKGFGKMMMQPFQGDSYTLRPQDMNFTGRYVCVLYKVNKDYAELYERISSTDLANPVSSIENGLGIFTGISADTISYRIEDSESTDQ